MTAPDLVERDRFVSGALHVVAFADAADPAGDLARLLPEVDLRWVELNRAGSQELGLALIAFANGNWVGVTDAELEVRHGQLKLELERTT